MSTSLEVQLKVAKTAEQLTESEELINLTTPDETRRLTLDEAMDLVQERYSNAIRLLGTL